MVNLLPNFALEFLFQEFSIWSSPRSMKHIPIIFCSLDDFNYLHLIDIPKQPFFMQNQLTAFYLKSAANF